MLIEVRAIFGPNPLPLGYRFGLLEPSDLPSLVQLLLVCFPPDLPLPEADDMLHSSSSSSLPSKLSRQLLYFAARATNGLAFLLSKQELRWGLLSRHGERLSHPRLEGQCTESLTLCVEEEPTNRLVAVVELCLRRPDGNLIPSIRSSSLRYDAACRPYLCNLAVSPLYRGQGLGKALVRIAENVVSECWEEDVVYLHLDETDVAAMSLYGKLGYERVIGVDPTGWYQEVMIEAARREGKSLKYYKREVGILKKEEESGSASEIGIVEDEEACGWDGKKLRGNNWEKSTKESSSSSGGQGIEGNLDG